MKGPLVSVLVADVEGGDSLKKTIESTTKQAYRNIEVVVLSPAHESETADNLEGIDFKRVFVGTYDEAGMINLGLEHARGEYYVYVDAGNTLQEGDIDEALDILSGEKTRSFVSSSKEFGLVSQVAQTPEGSGERFIRLIREYSVRSTHDATLDENREDIVNFANKFIADRAYDKKEHILRDLRSSKIWRIFPLPRVHDDKRGRLKSLYRRIKNPIQAMSGMRAKMKYKRAWVISDRPDEASDNGILFYDFLRSSHPEINAYYVISEESSDYIELRNRGVRVVAFNSREHQQLARYAEVEVSAFFNFSPFTPESLGRSSRAKRAFILHGMDQSDLSLHYSRLDVDLYCVVTQESYEFYKQSQSLMDIREKNLQVTGMVRYDLIRKREQFVDTSERTKIVIAPTWRRFLKYKPGSSDRVSDDALKKSEYYKNYSDLFASRELRDLCARYEIILIPHPELLERIDEFEIPDYFSIQTYKDLGTEKLYDLALQTKLFVSDYTSTTFDFAFLGANIAYFNFDEDEYYSERQELYRSWFYIDRDGLGPHFSRIGDLKKYLKSEEWTRRDDNIEKIWNQVPENSSEATFICIKKLLGEGHEN